MRPEQSSEERTPETKSDVLNELEWRGLIYDYTEGLPDLLATRKVTLYTGFDPTASSLQVGNLVPLLGLARLQRFGHSPIALAGGGTGMIGDPSGKSGERQLLERDEIEANIEAIKGQLARFLDFGVARNPARILNNVDWLGKLNLLDFLRDVGKHFTVNAMTAKESVRARLESESGISYAEFSYMLLQAYDFLHLFDAYGCLLQAGGSDQWGNITAGTELVRRMRGGGAYGLVYPLLTTPDGTKLGKTASGTVWLDPERTSPYRFYQYWLNQEDAVVIRCLKFLTWLGRGDRGSGAEAGGAARGSGSAAGAGAGDDASGPRPGGAGARRDGFARALRRRGDGIERG